MFNLLIGRFIAKHGLKALLILIGDLGVKITPSKEDDKVWKEVRKILKKL